MKFALVALSALALTGTAFADESLNAVNAELNALYAKVLSEQSSQKDKDALRAVERAWISYKDKQCVFESGSASPPSGAMRLDCELRLTKARIDELSHMICPGLGASVCNPH